MNHIANPTAMPEAEYVSQGRLLDANAATDPVFVADLVEFLVVERCIDKGAGDRAMLAQRETSSRIDTVLVELGLTSESALIDRLSNYLGLPQVTREQLPIAPILEDQLSGDYLKRVSILPFRHDHSGVAVATSDAFAADAVAAIGYLLEQPLAVHLASPGDIARAIEALYGSADLDVDLNPQQADGGGNHREDVQRLKDSASEAPIVRLVSRIIAQSVRARASDIHIESLRNSMRVRFRVDGVLLEHENLGAELQAPVVSRIKILAGLDIAERRLPQDGRISVAVDGRSIDLRVATSPVSGGENVVLRILDSPQADLNLSNLGFDDRTAGFLDELLARPNGLLLVTGPTGSGKSTTLYAALNSLNTLDRKIFTVEDPVEVQCTGVSQIPVRADLGLSFASALRSILRQDPDVVMIGEMRDGETARIGVRAALTGHMVLSTLHTNSAASAITRLIDLDLEPFLLSATLSGVVSQRLVRTLCSNCCQSMSEPDAATQSLLQTAGVSLTDLHAHRPNVAQGCDSCQGTGFLGRTCITETMIVDNTVRKLINDGATEHEIEQYAKKSGMVSLIRSGAQKVLSGLTTADEILRAARIW